ncbi:MAG: MBL fold metallo-hydrolase [Nevskiaceae bacterium]|nr:MAG: MBL fold metallo-hydrolase [Nevskiaceae bacterium]
MRFLSWSLGTLALLALASFGLLQLTPVQDRLIDQVIRKNVDNSAAQALFKDDAMRLLVCGSGSPLPHPTRARPCLAVIAGGKFYIVDTGPGSWNQLALRHIPAERIGAILYTHFHSDHIGELGEFNMQTWVAGRPAPLAVYGPEGVQRLVAGYSEAYALDNGYRTAHHGAEMLPPERGQMQAHPLALPADGHRVPAFEDGELKVSVFAVHHEPIEPAVGYRFDYKGRSLVISGDTRRDERMIAAAEGADVLAHEAQAQHLVARMQALAAEAGRPRIAKIFGDIPSYHTSPVEAAELANAAKVPLLLLYHLTPSPPNRIAGQVFMRGVKAVRPEGVVLSDDGTLITLPLAGGAPQVGRFDP